MANDIDELMSIDPLELTQENLDAIIAIHRQNRLNLEAGIKISKPRKEAGPKVPLTSLLDKIIKKEPPKGDGLPAVTKPSSGIRRI